MRKNRNDGQVLVNSPVRPSILYISLTLVEGQFDAILPAVIGNIPRNCICIVTLSCGMDRKEESFEGTYHRQQNMTNRKSPISTAFREAALTIMSNIV
eukprot:scaffold178_cov269-Chaetoceros_neogracile.AAC.13